MLVKVGPRSQLAWYCRLKPTLGLHCEVTVVFGGEEAGKLLMPLGAGYRLTDFVPEGYLATCYILCSTYGVTSVPTLLRLQLPDT
jgi:hypothetical protein